MSKRVPSTCRYCGNPIHWGVTQEGKRIPLDARAPVYIFLRPDGEAVVRASETHVSHFATCPKASQASADARARRRAREIEAT